ncbi:hypothetical protein A5662_07840 [Mycobacteriaceae bacterium 1482268.1]|nr:hypothetical protein A5662_07840 [Mycobacteriaceae bacterium 1482268.1]
MTETEALLAQVAELQRQVADLQQQVAQLTTVEPNEAEPRFRVRLNRVYDAPVTGYLSVSSADGRTGRVTLYVGDEDPPAEFVGIASTVGASDAYLGAVIREGEKFLLDARGKEPAFRCVFTPFF